jgi:hypothetical protein
MGLTHGFPRHPKAGKRKDQLHHKRGDKDPVTCTIILGILQMEVGHEEDLQALLEQKRSGPKKGTHPHFYIVFTAISMHRKP